MPRSIAMWLGLFLALACCVVGCAQGGASYDAGVRRDAARSDGTIGRDAESCDDEGVGDSCAEAMNLGSVSVGGSADGPFGLLQTTLMADWYVVEFPLEAGDSPDGGEPLPDGSLNLDGGLPPAMYLRGSGEPRIEFSVNEGDAFRFEVRTDCGVVGTCGEVGNESPATGLTEFSFRDEADPDGMTGFASRDVAWPERVYVRVHAVNDPECLAYRLRITR